MPINKLSWQASGIYTMAYVCVSHLRWKALHHMVICSTVNAACAHTSHFRVHNQYRIEVALQPCYKSSKTEIQKTQLSTPSLVELQRLVIAAGGNHVSTHLQSSQTNTSSWGIHGKMHFMTMSYSSGVSHL